MECPTSSSPAVSLACCSPSPGTCRVSFLGLPGGHFLSWEHRTCQHGPDQQKVQLRCHLLRWLQEQLSQLGETQILHRHYRAITAGRAPCSPCVMEQHPHTLHSIWAGSIAVGDLSCGEPRLSLLCLLGEQEFMISAPAQVCLRDGAKDECNVVEIVGRNHKNQEITVPVANLKLSCQPLVRGCFEDSGGDGCRELDIPGCLWTFP